MTTTPLRTHALTQDDALALFLAPPSRHIAIEGGGEVAYRRVGQGPDVLFVHGWPVSGATFRKLLPYLCEHVTCHIIDLVGAGESRFTAGETRIDLDHHIASVQQVVDALGLEDFSVIGHDSGGLIARHALGLDERVRSMVLCNTEQSQGLHWKFRQFLWMARLPGFGSILATLANNALLKRHPMVLGGCFADDTHLKGPFDELFLKPLKKDQARRWAATLLARNFDTRRVDALGELHARMQMPVKLAWGERDPFFPVDWAREMVETFPMASIEVIADAQLFVHEERPEDVARAILPTLLLDKAAADLTTIAS